VHTLDPDGSAARSNDRKCKEACSALYLSKVLGDAALEKRTQVDMLRFNGSWRFNSPGPIPSTVEREFLGLIRKIVSQGERKQVVEHFKYHFSNAVGTAHHTSSSENWAWSDLEYLMDKAAANAPVFIDAFYTGCEDLHARWPEMALPDVVQLNRILFENFAGYQIQPPNLIATQQHTPIAVPERPPSLDEQAYDIIEGSLRSSERLLDEDKPRQAVQEILWSLETVATAFRGVDTEAGSIEGKYFNKIVAELRASNRGTNVAHILSSMVALHGYLSSPTGGGVRHGVDLKEGLTLQLGEARLYCNLIRSYITFLVSEHERLTRGSR